VEIDVQASGLTPAGSGGRWFQRVIAKSAMGVIKISYFCRRRERVQLWTWSQLAVQRWTVNTATTFDRIVENLGLLPEQYLASSALKEWVRLNKDEKYVPPDLLEAWGFSEDEAA
jgi:hypothetical protein